jgi:hypothetical protein
MIDSWNTLTGTWTYNINPYQQRTILTIKEESQIANNFWRGISVLVGRDYNINKYFQWVRKAIYANLLRTK